MTQYFTAAMRRCLHLRVGKAMGVHKGLAKPASWRAARGLVYWVLVATLSSTLLLSCGKPSEVNVVVAGLVKPAIDEGNVARVALLLRCGMDVNANLYTGLGKMSLLSYATRQDKPAMVRLLLARGAAVNQVNQYPNTALCLVKSPEVFKLLLTHGARFQRISFSEGTQEWTYPAEFLARLPTVAPLVLDYAPDSLFRQYDFYEQLLLGFISRDDTARVRQLVRRGASLVKPTRVGVKYKVLVSNQPLYYARSPEMALLLAQNGAKTMLAGENELLVRAIGAGSLPLLRYAEQHGSPLHTPGNLYFTNAQDSVMVQYLLKRGVSIDSRDAFGNTLLMRTAFSTHNASLERFLLRHGADKTLVNNAGASYLRGPDPRTGDHRIASADTISYYWGVEQMPALPGGRGTPAIQAYVQRALARRLPAEVRSGLVKGRAQVQLTVGPSGVVRNAEVQPGQDEACNEAVLAAVAQLPRLVPGRHNGRPVSVQLWLTLNLAAQ
jgi:hypothetical protein